MQMAASSILVEVAQLADVVVELGEQLFDAIDRLFQQRRFACGKAERRAFHRFGEGRLISELFDKGEDELVHHAVHFLRRFVLEAAPAQLVAGNPCAIGVAVRLREDVVECRAERLFHLLGFELLFVERAHKHEVSELTDDLDGVGDAAFPHLLPNGVDFVFGRSGNHGASLRRSKLLFGGYTDDVPSILFGVDGSVRAENLVVALLCRGVFNRSGDAF